MDFELIGQVIGGIVLLLGGGAGAHGFNKYKQRRMVAECQFHPDKVAVTMDRLAQSMEQMSEHNKEVGEHARDISEENRRLHATSNETQNGIMVILTKLEERTANHSGQLNTLVGRS